MAGKFSVLYQAVTQKEEERKQKKNKQKKKKKKEKRNYKYIDDGRDQKTPEKSTAGLYPKNPPPCYSWFIIE